jgi:methylenetetrahydrofolate dehydrogenase (NADP+)/methenyltetrahydrofolate cyclohydrolase
MIELLGKPLTSYYTAHIKKLISRFGYFERKPRLVVLTTLYDTASLTYQKARGKVADNLDVEIIEIDCTNFPLHQIKDYINRYNEDINTDAIMINRPVRSDLNFVELVNLINPKKDVEGVGATNMGLLNQNKDCFIAPTALSVFLLLRYYFKKIAGKRIVIVGRSPNVGKPLANLLLNVDCTVIVCHSKSVNLKKITRFADILIVTVGKPNLIELKYVKKKQTVIDVGYHYVNDQIVGDVTQEAKNYVAYATPVPGGVGSITNYALLFNVIKAKFKELKNTDLVNF